MPTTSDNQIHEGLVQKLMTSTAIRVGPASGVDDEVICRAERRLGLRFSPSYRWFLETFGGGYYYCNEINGLAPPAHLEPPREDISEFVGDVVARHEINVRNPKWNPYYLEILNVDGDEIYVLDASLGQEQPVLLWEPGSGEWGLAYKNVYALLDTLA